MVALSFTFRSAHVGCYVEANPNLCSQLQLEITFNCLCVKAVVDSLGSQSYSPIEITSILVITVLVQLVITDLVQWGQDVFIMY